MTIPARLTAAYRLQFHHGFTFADAAKLIPYLSQLGISHIYASPLLKARSDSPHGYDIVDHHTLNPEIGSTADFAHYVNTLHQHGMGQILDIVPNHMGVGGDDNLWWLDVLENGEASVYADYFDIDWHPVNPALRNKLLVPFLDDHYGSILEKGELNLTLNADKGQFVVHYHEHCLPIDPRTYPIIVSYGIDELEQSPDIESELISILKSFNADCRQLPRRTDTSARHRDQRRRAATICKQRLAALCQQHPGIYRFLQQNITRFNGKPGIPKSFDRLHRLLEAQAYRLAHWRVATSEINYRRFFDINQLAAVRANNEEVFRTTHQLIGQLVADAAVDGLRIDHPDGLSDPLRYYRNLQHLVQHRSTHRCYLFVEKILATHERLTADWPVDGTTGYETAYLLNGIFVYPAAEQAMTQLYTRFTKQGKDFEHVLYRAKKLVIGSILSNDLTVLANSLYGIAQRDRHTRDFTYQGLRDAVCEVVACFPVYRTYINAGRISEEDRRYVQWAIAQAKHRNPANDPLIFDFVDRILLLETLIGRGSNMRRRMLHFVLRFQQYTAPVMAKAMEDTACYVYNRLASLNDVGFDPRVFSISPEKFHHANEERLKRWPHTLVTSSTHDSKRSEDVRARINVLTELADEWKRHVQRWGRLNRHKKRLVNDQDAPSRNDEYLLYQTLIGSWPLQTLDEAGLATYRERIVSYLVKAAREAKQHTSWIHPNQDYEEALLHFVEALFDHRKHNAFLASFIPFQKRVSRLGLFNSLAQTLLKLCIPGTPDIYQGNELWLYQLVDPDNRQAVNYHHRRQLLDSLMQQQNEPGDITQAITELLTHIEDGRAKLYLTWRVLNLRLQHADLFRHGDYLPLAIKGEKAQHIVAFARHLQDKIAVIAVARWYARLFEDNEGRAPVPANWGNTAVEAPAEYLHPPYHNVLTGETLLPTTEDPGHFPADHLFSHFPVALLVNDAVKMAPSSRVRH